MQLLSKFHVNRSKNKNDGSIQLRNLGSDLLIGSEKHISWESKAHFLEIQSTSLVLLFTI